MLEKYGCVTPPQESTETMQEIASRNFSIWNSAIQSGNPKEVAALYIADVFDLRVVERESEAVAKAAVESGVARI